MATTPTPQPIDRQQFAEQVLMNLGAPTITTNMDIMYAWMEAENSGAPGVQWNPLNIGPGKTYPNFISGADAVSGTLIANQGKGYGYNAIIKDLQAGNASYKTLASAVGNSSWDAGHYNNGGGPGSALIADESAGIANAGVVLGKSTHVPHKMKSLNPEQPTGGSSSSNPCSGSPISIKALPPSISINWECMLQDILSPIFILVGITLLVVGLVVLARKDNGASSVNITGPVAPGSPADKGEEAGGSEAAESGIAADAGDAALVAA